MRGKERKLFKKVFLKTFDLQFFVKSSNRDIKFRIPIFLSGYCTFKQILSNSLRLRIYLSKTLCKLAFFFFFLVA